jgi:catechol 2,3-dioxygenase-like lactoylglutathione lyase family enzyme
MDFYTNILGMTILRHEEFKEGCDAKCNGPYDGKWSKTMTGYGNEDNNFVIELTYNYDIRSYERGNDYNFISIQSSQAIANIKEKNYPFSLGKHNQVHEVVDPNGYKFLVSPSSPNHRVTGLSLHVTDLKVSADFWLDQLKFSGQILDDRVEVNFLDFNFQLLLEKCDKIDRAKAYGRTAFSCPTSELKPLQTAMETRSKLSVLTPYIQLDTPGKATVCVVILADPNQHEICFVGDEGFRELSQIDEKAQSLLDESIKKDKSDQWHEKRAKLMDKIQPK